MTKKSWGIIILSVLLAAFVFVQFFVVVIPAGKIVRLERFSGSFVFLESGKVEFVKIIPHRKLEEFGYWKAFHESNLFISHFSMDTLFSVNYDFAVVFPKEKISASDTAALFGEIRRTAYVAMAKASVCIDRNFYGASNKFSGYSYPIIFKCFLDEKMMSGKGKYCFALPTISRICVVNKNAAGKIESSGLDKKIITQKKA